MHREQDEEAISASGSGHAEAEEEDQCEEQSDVFVVVGTGEERGQQAGGTWNPCKGRLLLINFASKQNGMHDFFEEQKGFALLFAAHSCP